MQLHKSCIILSSWPIENKILYVYGKYEVQIITAITGGPDFSFILLVL